MATQTFSSLKLKMNIDYKTLEINDKTIMVSQYLSTSDKYDLIEITLQKAKTGDIYSPILLDALFHLHIVYLYTNITFTAKQKEDELKLYDILNSNGVIDKIIALIPEEEYQRLYEYLTDAADAYLKYSTTLTSAIKEFTASLPEAMSQASDIVENFDPSKFQAVVDFATAANGGRSIVTNLPVE